MPWPALLSHIKAMPDEIRQITIIVLTAKSASQASSHLQQISSLGPQLPVIILGDGLDDTEICQILDAGARDVLSWPVQAAQLGARLRSAARRGPNKEPLILSCEGIEIDPHTGDARHAGLAIPLTKKEASIIRVLAGNVNKTVERRVVYDALYAFATNPPFETTLDVHVFNIRKKLDAAHPGAGRALQTVPGRGFALIEKAGQ